MSHILSRLFATALVLTLSATARAADDKELSAEVRDAFKQFATAVKEDEYEKAARWVAPPGDDLWTAFAKARSRATDYGTALDKRFGKGEASDLLGPIASKGGLAEHFYEVRGEIQDVKAAGKGRAHVRVWTSRPDWKQKGQTAVHERKFTAVKVDGVWKFQLHDLMGGTPVLKPVKRVTAEGKEAEVYAEHFPKKPGDAKTWEELKPISYDGREEDLKGQAATITKLAEILRDQTALVEKGKYKTRKEATEGLQKAVKELKKAAK